MPRKFRPPVDNMYEFPSTSGLVYEPSSLDVAHSADPAAAAAAPGMKTYLVGALALAAVVVVLGALILSWRAQGELRAEVYGLQHQLRGLQDQVINAAAPYEPPQNPSKESDQPEENRLGDGETHDGGE
tara:strand:+ start:7184 stop:7570 length:387 start_codon:yes stop_codon:yes gene_type:complete